ncbi:unnamed protein product [Sphagnum troendelagicum]|uniref:Uncharacterized protein n=1 Tax=Sphagnum troendelagicum TaxID=128251 RepID=A0ABP0UBT4_9BRYO
MIFQEASAEEYSSSNLADFPPSWVDKLNEKLGVIFSREQQDAGRVSIGTLAMDPMQEGCHGHDSLDGPQPHKCNITAVDSQEFSAAGSYECRKASSAAGRVLVTRRIHESPEARVSCIVTSAAELNETPSSEMKAVIPAHQTLPPRATSKGSRRDSSAARSSGGMSRSPSQVCPFLSDLETAIDPACNLPPPSAKNSPATGLACGLFPTRLSRRRSKNRLQKVNSDGTHLQEGHVRQQRSSKGTTFRRLRKLWQPKYVASPKALAAHEKQKNLIKLIPTFKTQQQQEHFAARRNKSPARSVKTQKKWPYLDGTASHGQVANSGGGLRQRLQPRKWLPCRSSHGMSKKKGIVRASEKELNQLQSTHAEHFFGEQQCQQGQWIKTDSECQCSLFPSPCATVLAL